MSRFYIRCNCKERDLTGNCTEYTGKRTAFDFAEAGRSGKAMIEEGHENVTIATELIIATHKEIEKI